MANVIPAELEDGQESRQPRALPAQVFDELRGHPFETAALVTMLAAFLRLTRSFRGEQRKASATMPPTLRNRPRPILPIGLMAAICLIGLGSCSTPTPQAQRANAVSTSTVSHGDQEDVAAMGRIVVQQQCAACHAIDQQTRSPHSEAPPMNTLLAAYDPESLTEDLIEGVRVGHDDMPLFDFDVRAADAIVAYLKSISERPIESGRERH